MNADLERINLRLDLLERQNCRLRLALCLLFVPILGIFWIAARTQEGTPQVTAGASQEVHAQRFVLTDSRGRELAVWGVGASGPFLHFLAGTISPAATAPAAIPVSLDTSGLIFSDAAGTETAINASGLDLAASGSHAFLKAQSLEMKPAQSKAEVNLRLTSAGPTLLLQDAGGSLAAIGVHAFSATATGAAQRTGAASIVLVAPNRRILWSAPGPSAHR